MLEDAVVAAIRQRARRGWSIRVIAKRLGVHRETVRHYLRQGPVPRVQIRLRGRRLNAADRDRARQSFLASAGRNAVRVLQELKQAGVNASIATVRRAVRDLRHGSVRLETDTGPPQSLRGLSAFYLPTSAEIERDLKLARRFARVYERHDPDELESELMTVLVKLEVHRRESRKWEARLVKAFKNRCLNWRRDRGRREHKLERLDANITADGDASFADIVPGATEDVEQQLVEHFVHEDLDDWHRTVLDALIKAQGNRSNAARLLGVSRGTILNALPRILAVLAKHGFGSTR